MITIWEARRLRAPMNHTDDRRPMEEEEGEETDSDDRRKLSGSGIVGALESVSDVLSYIRLVMVMSMTMRNRAWMRYGNFYIYDNPCPPFQP